ncbi:hypothetical protein BgiBS90_004082 [Biomphalaria glabrata]|nr:hypothetical protein BgiBS90_004082 [Biomphalaria glabrata]
MRNSATAINGNSRGDRSLHMNINDLYVGKKQRQKERNCAIHTENIHYGEPKRNKSKPKRNKRALEEKFNKKTESLGGRFL